MATNSNRLNTVCSKLPISAQVPVQTLCVRYPMENGELNPAPAYHGDISIWQTLVSLLQQPQSLVEVHILAGIETKDVSRQQLSALAQAQIAQCLETIQSRNSGRCTVVFSHCVLIHPDVLNDAK